MKLLRLLISFGLISVLIADEREEYYNIVIRTSLQMGSLNYEQVNKVMLLFAKTPSIRIEWSPHGVPEKKDIQLRMQSLIEDATTVKAPTEVGVLYGPNFKLSDYEAIRKRLVTRGRLRALIIKKTALSNSTVAVKRHFKDLPYTCRLIAMYKTLKNPNNIIVEDNIIKVDTAHICQQKDSEGNIIRYRSVTGIIWRDNLDGTKIDVTLDSELD